MPQNPWLQGYVLHRRAYRETSFLVDFFTLELGKVSAVARGVRSAKSDRKSLLQPFQPLRLQLSGKGELKNLTQVESVQPAVPLTGNGLFCALYVNELTNRVMPQALASESLFDAYQSSLQGLCVQTDFECVLREYEFALLEDMGLLADWGTDAHTQQAVEPDLWYEFSLEQGMVAAGMNQTKGAIDGATLLALSDGVWTERTKKAAKWLNRLALQPLLGDKPLKSRELFTSR